jgi:hypothetical protein
MACFYLPVRLVLFYFPILAFFFVFSLFVYLDDHVLLAIKRIIPNNPFGNPPPGLALCNSHTARNDTVGLHRWESSGENAER